jgi:TonB family protein
MKLAVCFLLAVVALPPSLAAQAEQVFDPVTSRAFLQQLERDGVYFFISSKIAESLVVHRVEVVWPHKAMEARISGTVIVAFELTKDGNVAHPMVVSGPALLRPPVLAAVRQWRFKPYPLSGEHVTVATSIPVTVSNF